MQYENTLSIGVFNITDQTRLNCFVILLHKLFNVTVRRIVISQQSNLEVVERFELVDMVVVAKQFCGHAELLGAGECVEEHCPIPVIIKTILHCELKFRK